MTSRTGFKREARSVLITDRGDLPLPCDRCGEVVTRFGVSEDDGQVHHRDHDPSNNDPRNLELLHGRCHRKTHSESAITRARNSAAAIRRDATAPLRRPDVVAKRASTLKARYADPKDDLRDRVSASVKASLATSEVREKFSAAQVRRWSSQERRAQQSEALRASFSDRPKKQCPYGCGLETYAGPLARHVNSRKCKEETP